jgi:hypothetical protein
MISVLPSQSPHHLTYDFRRADLMQSDPVERERILEQRHKAQARYRQRNKETLAQKERERRARMKR